MTKNMPAGSDYKKIMEWLEEYHSESSAAQKAKYKTKIVAQMIPVVKHIARTIARRSTDPIEDMVQAGFIGLLKAVDNYSKEKNDNFKVYAGYLIIGEMKHYLRDKLTAIRVPRHIQELSVRIHNFTNSLTPDELERITTEDVASALNISARTVDYALQMERRRTTVSLEDVFKEDFNNSLGYEELLPTKDYKEKAEVEDFKIIFDNLIDKLPDEEKVYLDMYYKQDMSKKDIAEALQVSQMIVNRRIKSAFKILSHLIEGKNEVVDEDSI